MTTSELETKSNPSLDTDFRYGFGENWNRFLSVLNEERIQEAEKSLKMMLDKENLNGLRFLDAGSGSGLFSLAARRLGAEIVSFDFDPSSVNCTRFLKNKYFPEDNNWIIHQGSVLDKEFLSALGQFDIVYSWGVLHHTGKMWMALENVMERVGQNGLLFIAIYNDQGFRSRFWWWVKMFYNKNFIGRVLISSIFIPYFFTRALFKSLIKMRNEFSAYKSSRGMSIYYDWFDWVGGFPFEVAGYQELKNYYEQNGFSLVNSLETTGWGNNQLVFKRNN